MTIKFIDIDISNFLSLGTIHVNFEDSGFTLINGKNINSADGAISNGSGKSSLFEALIWCLTGTTLRNSNDIINKNADDGALVTLNFYYNNDLYKILRSKNHSVYKSNLKIFKNGEDISGKGLRDTQKIIEQTLPELTSQYVSSVIVLGQGMPSRFTNNSPSGRKEILERLSNSDFMIEDLKKRIQNRKQTIKQYLDKDNTELISLTSEYSTNKKSIKSYAERLSTIKSLDEYVNSIKQSEVELSDIEKDICSLKTGLNNIITESQSINDRLRDAVEVLNRNQQEQLEQYQNERTSLCSNIAYKKQELLNVQSKISELESITDICPFCKQKLQNIQLPDIKPYYTQKSKIEECLNDLNTKLNILEKSFTNSQTQAKEEYNKNTQEDQKSLLQLVTTNDNIKKTLEQQICKRNELNSVITKLKCEYESAESTKTWLLSETDKLKTRQAKIIDLQKTLNSRIEDFKQHQDVLTQFETFIKRDFRGYLLSNVISYIDDKVKEYSSYIFDNAFVEFVLNSNNIDILLKGTSYENLSGGEKQKVDLIVQFALRDMLSDYIGFHSSILVLDEIFDNLDTKGCERLIDLILTKFTDLNSIYIISHHAEELNIPVDNIITVIKDDSGISYIEK